MVRGCGAVHGGLAAEDDGRGLGRAVGLAAVVGEEGERGLDRTSTIFGRVDRRGGEGGGIGLLNRG